MQEREGIFAVFLTLCFEDINDKKIPCKAERRKEAGKIVDVLSRDK